MQRAVIATATALILLALSANALSAGAEITDCDRLAANPPDPDRVTDGVPRSRVDVKAAIAACRRALAADADTARFAYQLGRVYFYDGDSARALEYIGRAAALGYRQAEFVMGALIDNRRPGVAYDICDVEDYWYRAATKGHLHARVAYVRHVIKDRFAQCDVQATPGELAALIDISASGSQDYFLRLLVEDLKEAVALYVARAETG